jgi:hypothetical protein
MTKFRALLFKSLPNAAHFNYCSQVGIELSNATAAIVAALGALVAEFNSWLAKETALMEWVRKNELTAKIAEADNRMSHALVAIRALVRFHEYSPTPAIAEAAHRVHLMLRNYGYVYTKPYEEQEGDIRTIIAQFTGEYAPDVPTLDMAAQFTELQGAFAEFHDLLSQRDAHSLQKPKETFPVVRRGIENVYHQIVTLVDAGAALNTSPDFAAFIDKLNPEIERLNHEFHHVRRNIAAAQPEPIPQQAFTGNPITPTPAVYYVTPHEGAIRLELGRDYNFTYKNNKDVGNAQCTIHGKGLFTGSKTVTFIIVQ